MIASFPRRADGCSQAFDCSKDGTWLDGGTTYRLHVPPNPPAKRFRSTTAYDEDTCQMVITEQGRPDIFFA